MANARCVSRATNAAAEEAAAAVTAAATAASAEESSAEEVVTFVVSCAGAAMAAGAGTAVAGGSVEGGTGAAGESAKLEVGDVAVSLVFGADVVDEAGGRVEDDDDERGWGFAGGDWAACIDDDVGAVWVASDSESAQIEYTAMMKEKRRS